MKSKKRYFKFISMYKQIFSHLVIRNAEFNRIPRKSLNKIYKYSSSKDNQSIYKICVFNFHCIPRKGFTKIKCIDAFKKQRYLKSHFNVCKKYALFTYLFLNVRFHGIPEKTKI